MRPVTLGPGVLGVIEREARDAYPDEACGFLFSEAGGDDASVRRLVGARPAPNEVTVERRRRFVISAEGLRSAESTASERGELVAGFYHSHPDHPAAPSAFDTEHAWPWYTYVVVSVDRAGACVAGAFELDDGGTFRRCDLLPASGGTSVAAPAPLRPPVGREV